MVVILHNIRSLYNVGAIFRTADAAGIEKLYLSGITPTPYDSFNRLRSKLTKVSLGAEKYITWEKVKSTSKLIEKLKRDGYQVFAIEQANGSIPYYKVKIDSKRKRKFLALVVGSEVNGLPLAILRRVHKILEIPMFGKKESLNVAVALGIVIYSLIFSRN
jgi:tRNA G18 (ribose-2'-O)-methylase SpoU